MSLETRLPHSLRLVLFFLRLAIGLNFFYLGWSALFNRSLELALRARSIGGLYAWLATPSPIAPIPAAVFAWLFLIVGILLILGLFTRLASIVAIVLVLASWLPTVSFASFDPAQFINDEIIVLLGLLILILGRAGTYLGIDKFLHWSRRRRETTA